MNEWSFFFLQNSWIQDGRIQDGCHHQYESEWMNEAFFVKNGWIQDSRFQDGCHQQINQIELVWVRVRVQLECFWVNLTVKVSESNMAVFKMAAIIELSQNEWVKFFYVQMVGANLGMYEWVWEKKNSDGWIQDGGLQDGCQYQVRWQ